MKKILFYIAAIALTIGCSDMVEDLYIETDEAAVAETTFVNLNLSFESESDTRVSVTQGETDEDNWKVDWQGNDAIIVYSIDNDASKILYYNSSTDTFSGEVYTGANRIYHCDDSTWFSTLTTGSNKYLYLYCSSTTFTDGGSVTIVSDDVVTFGSDSAVINGLEAGDEDENINVTMAQVGAAVDFRMTFVDVPEAYNLYLTSITLGGVPTGGDESEYVSVPYNIVTDPQKEVDDSDFVYDTNYGTQSYSVSSIDVATNPEYSVQFGVLPFTIESGKKLNVTLEFNNGTISKSFDLTNSGADFTFTRGTYGYLEKSYDLSDLLEDNWLSEAADSFSGGSGSEEDPYQISSAEELAYLSLGLSGIVSLNSSDGIYYKLTADIDLSGKEWCPIGNSSNYFRGNFDGNGKTITGLTIDSDSNYQGLFGRIYEASISNLTIDTPSVVGASSVGAVCGYASYYSTISNCDVEGGFITGSDEYTGGLVGFIDDYTTITKCYNTSDVSGVSHIGGVIGRAYRDSTVTDCYNAGDISGEWKVGGVIGIIFSSSVTKCYNTGDVSGNYMIGGVIGSVIYDSNDYKNYVTACYNTGDVSSIEWGNYVGGLVGYINYNTYTESEYGINTVTACYNVGSVYYSNSDSVGYLIGYIGDEAPCTVSECYYLPTTVVTLNEYGTSLSSVLDLNKKVTDMNTAAEAVYFTAGEGNILPSLLGESIEYVEPTDYVENFNNSEIVLTNRN